MGKSSKRKKKKNKRKFYNKKEFVNIFCAGCEICIGDPTFCYSGIYKSSPSLFLTKVHEALKEVKDWNAKRGSFGLDPAQFRYAVCNFVAKTMCHEKEFINCENFECCYGEFKDQVYGRGGKDLLKHRRQGKKQKKRNKKKKYVVKAYPTAFMSNNDAWKKVIKRILADGDNDREQNTAEAGSV